ncbi:type I polyketide synthase [Nonomuraea sp. LPB2021202275-12-8]|uniref:type I polyketide synthase n=1 Tax=Nonomuraea sp. LPB2021202275-12-8 TaxID=3120159 RepID=UPI00300CA442
MGNLVEPIAIIGMAGRFPAAVDTQQLWRNLVAGEEAVRFPAEDELRSSGVSREALDDLAYVRAVAEPEGIDLFDAGFFGLTRREAEACDPQLRLYLETSHAAVENAGYDASRLGRAGVFSSVAANRYGIGRLGSLEALRSATGMAAGMWNNPDSASTLVSYKLNLHGPSMTVQTACSSSLVAVHLAVNALRLNECDVALAGGADVEFPVGHGYWWAQDGPLSRDGHCRPFDAAASGTIFGSGVGVVVLKRLADAMADGDRISAVIRAVAVNNDGANKVGFTAPSADRQTEVVLRAMEVADVRPEDIGYVETHATATRLGDAIEISALRKAFSARATSEPCPIGSIKGNVGHLGHASGITSLIKAALSLSHEQIPASINLEKVNPFLELEDSPFFVNDTLRPWPRSAGHRRLAGVSSFGIGGTNAHAILEEAPPRAVDPAPEPTQLIVWSGRTPSAAEAYPEQLARAFKESADPLSSVSFTLREGRTPHPVRGAVVVESMSDAATAVLDHARRIVTPEEQADRSTAFLFPGEGAQHPHMAAELYRTEPAFSAALDECFDLFEAHSLPQRQIWDEASEGLEDTTVAQPLLFSVEYALGRLWLALGIEPDVLLGHGIGEFAAATLAEVFTLPEAVRLVSARARAMGESPQGAMVAVTADMDTVSPLLFGSLGVAVVNSDRQTVVGGSADDVRRFEDEVLAGARLAASRLRSRHAFHTPAMMSAAERFRLAFDGIEPRSPRWKIYSASTGGLAEAAQVSSVDFWVQQLTRPVLFEQALEAVLSDGDRVLLEVGPGRTLTTLARSHPQVRAKQHLTVPTLPGGPSKGATERTSFLHALARLWTLGLDVNWSSPAATGPRERVPLPGYPYQRERYWIERASPSSPLTDAHEAREPEGRAVFRLPTWVEAAPAGHHDTDVGDRARPLVFLPDDSRRADDLVALLDEAGWNALRVRHGSSYSGAADRSSEFVIRPRRSADVVRLLDELRDSQRYPELIIDATQLGGLAEPALSGIDDQLDAGFHRIVELLQEAARRAPDKLARNVLVVTELSADVTGGETVHPVRAMLLGLLRSYMLENPRVMCKLVDVQSGVTDDRLLAELRGLERSEIVALRGDRRWVPGERELVPDGAGPVDLRRRGAYVITGGLGGLGLAVARGLADTGLQPRLLLLGRHATGGHDAEPAELREIRALGAECRIEACDVTDVDALRRVIDQASDSFGGINGVFHLAGVAGGGMLQFRTAAQVSATLAPKVHGTLALVEVLQGRPDLDFFVAFSSRAALRGLVGSADYAAANAFLDAVVRRQPLAGCASIAINWPSWAEVGMAARQGRQPQAGRSGSGTDVRRWSTPLSAENYPILDEHRLDGVPVLPGTAQVDFVLRAFREAIDHANGRPAQLRHMVFRQPITTPEPVSLEVGFESHEDLWRFTVRTAPLSSSPGSSDDYRVHTTGEIRLVDTRADKVDLDGLRASLPERRIPANDPDNRLFTIGPRWPGEEIWLSREDISTKLAVLTFPEAFDHELDEHALHPTLLDAAVSLARDPDHEPPHAPFAYQSIVVHRSIPGFAYSHIRRRPSGSDTIVADIDVLTAGGDVAVEVRGFTMRRVDESMVAPETYREERGADAGQDPSLDDGITPATGVSMLLRILGRPSHGQVAITVSGEDAVLKNSEDLPGDTGDDEQPDASAMARARPGSPGRIAGGAPSDEASLEARLTEMWCAEFGVESVRPDENFFDLGGDSFTAVGLVEEIRRGFGVDVGIAVIFDHPTVAELVAELRRLTE